jgi:hypothetical protein
MPMRWGPSTAGLLGGVLLCACSMTTQPKLTALVCHGLSSHFELSLVSSVGGQPSPVAATEWDATHHAIPGFRLPTSGWQVVSRDSGGDNVRSDGYQVHAVQGPDGSWQVDSGFRLRLRMPREPTSIS